MQVNSKLRYLTLPQHYTRVDSKMGFCPRSSFEVSTPATRVQWRSLAERQSVSGKS